MRCYTAVERTLDYASVPATSHFAWLAKAAPVVAVAGAAIAVITSISSAQSLIGTFSGCATGRQEAAFSLLVLPPAACALPATAWFFAGTSKMALLVCRCSLWSGVAAWLTAWACMFS